MKRSVAMIMVLTMAVVNLPPPVYPAQAAPATAPLPSSPALYSSTALLPHYPTTQLPKYPTARIPTDPLFPQQWTLTHVHTPDARDVTTGSPEVVIAVLDTGIDVDQPDLAGRLWTSPSARERA